MCSDDDWDSHNLGTSVVVRECSVLAVQVYLVSTIYYS